MIELGSILKKTECGVIFPGLGMVYSLQDKMDLFEKLLAKLNEITTFKVIPMVGHYNMRGFNQLMLEKTGFINRVSFQDGAAVHGPEQSVGGRSEELRRGSGHRLRSALGAALRHGPRSGQESRSSP